jgi:transposase, IS30 family
VATGADRRLAAAGLPAGSGAAGVPRDPYLSLFVQGRGALRRELQRYLGRGRAMRSPRGKRLPQGRGRLRDTLHSSQRPPEAADRAVPGHWEGDLVFGRRPSAVGTLVERHRR